MVPLPLHWWTEEFYASLAKAVRPATSLTRRKMHVLRMPMPLAGFNKILEDLPDGCIDGLERDEDGRLKPTRTSSTSFTYDFLFKKMRLIDLLFRLQLADVKKGGARRPLGPGRKRGLGASRLQLGVQAQRKGRKALLLSTAVGYASVKLVVRKKQLTCPKLTMTWLNATMDQHGHVTWPTEMDPSARAKCRVAMRLQLGKMLKDKDYPTHKDQRAALTQDGDSVLDLASIRAAADAAKLERLRQRALQPAG